MHISVAQETISKLLPSLKILEKELAKKSKEFKNIIKNWQNPFTRCNTIITWARIFRLPGTAKKMH
jgi:hypothetical protein